MNVIVSAGGRFHCINLAHQLVKRGCLQKLFSFSCKKHDYKKIDKNLVCSINSCKVLDAAFQKLRLFNFINAAAFNSVKDNLFDSLVSNEIKKIERTDIFVGWANYSLKSLKSAKAIGAKTVIESGSCHIKEQQEILQAEYDKWGIKFAPIYQPTLDKMVQEYSTADYIMTLSDFSYQSFVKQGVDARKVLKIPCGIDVDFFSETSIKDKKFRVIFVGLINLRKGVQYLIEAWNSLNLPQNSTELILVGNVQKDMQRVISKLKILPNIKFLGSCDRATLKKLYYSSALFVLPSVEDGFGMVVGEAMATGLPVICSKNAGASEIIQDAVHGFLIDSRSAQSLSEKILWCYQNPDVCRKMGALGKQRIQDFSWDKYGEKVFKTYQNILQEV
jgi:glycosyltransferase involved in cell wall biosynthesis